MTLSKIILLYAFWGTIFTHSIFSSFNTYPSIAKTTLNLHLLTIYFFSLLFILNLIMYKKYYIYINKYILLVFFYILSAAFSILVNQEAAYLFPAIYSFRSMLFPAIISLMYVQILEKNDINKIGKIFTTFAIINIVYSLSSMAIYWGNLTTAHIAGVFTDRNLLARFLAVANTFVLIRILTKGKLTFFCKETIFVLLTFLCITFLMSRGGYVIYIITTAFIGWKSQNLFIRKFGPYFLSIILILFSVMIFKRMKDDKMNVKNSSDLARISVLNAGINMIKSKPILGVGYGMSSKKFKKYENKTLPGLTFVTTIHNIYIAVFAEQGIVGLVIFLLLNFGLLFSIYMKILQIGDFKKLQNEYFCFTSLGIFLLQGLIYHTSSNTALYWIIIAMCIIVLKEPLLQKHPH